MATFIDADHPRSAFGLFTKRTFQHPELVLEATAEEEGAAEWEAQFSDSVVGCVDCPVERADAVRLSRHENLDVARRAQAAASLTASDLETLIDSRQVVNAGALANPNIGQLPFTVQAELIDYAFPEERAIGAGNKALHPELLEALAGDEYASVRTAAARTIATLRDEPLAA